MNKIRFSPKSSTLERNSSPVCAAHKARPTIFSPGKLGGVAAAALLAVLFLAGCAPATGEQSTPVIPTDAAAPAQTTVPVVTQASTATDIPQSVLTAAPLISATPEVLNAPKDATMTPPTASPLPENSIISSWIKQAVQDLAGRLNVGEEDIQVVAFEPVVWPDGGLGCPEPGVLYTQVLVEGFRIRLQYNGQNYDYHGSPERAPFLCEQK